MNAQQLANKLTAVSGGVGAINVQGQQVGAALNIQPQQVGYYGGVGLPAAPGQVDQRVVPYDNAAYNSGGLSWLGFGTTNVPAGAVNQTINIATLRPFKPQLLYFTSVVFGLLINQVGLEGNNLFANTLGVPIELYSEVSNAPQIQWPTLDPSTGIQFIVSNPTGGDLSFTGGFWGTMVQRG